MMTSVISRALGALLVIAAAPAPSGGQESPGANTNATDRWRVELVSTGGITGRGHGGVAVQSDGTAQLLQFDPQGGRRRRAPGAEAKSPVEGPPVAATCSTTLARREFTALDNAVSQIPPEDWRTGHFPIKGTPCCDLIEWTLTITRRSSAEGKERLVSSWVADTTTSADVPASIVAVHEALAALWPTVRNTCSTTR